MKSEVVSCCGEAVDILGNIEFSQNMVENLINDLMDLGKLQKGVFKFDNELFSLPNVIMQAFETVKATALKRKIQLCELICNKNNLDCLHKLEGDARRYMQIFLNFLSNAIKFTPEGGKVTIKIEAKIEDIMVQPDSEIFSNLQGGRLDKLT